MSSSVSVLRFVRSLRPRTLALMFLAAAPVLAVAGQAVAAACACADACPCGASCACDHHG